VKNLNTHTTFLNVINLLVVAGILCLLAPNAVDRNRESTFEEWLESSQDIDPASHKGDLQGTNTNSDEPEPEPVNPADSDAKHEITSLYAAWYYFHQSVTLGHGLIFDASSWKHLKLTSESSFNSDFSAGLIISNSELTSHLSGDRTSGLRKNISPDLEFIRHKLNVNAP
jgi:hypothetical protein